MVLKIHCYSDDCIDVEGVAGVDGADTCANSEVHVEVEIGPLPGNGATLIVALHYMTATIRSGCWEARLSRMEEGRPIIPAAVGEGGMGDYDIGVEVDVPPGTLVRVWKCTKRGLRELVGEGATLN